MEFFDEILTCGKVFFRFPCVLAVVIANPFDQVLKFAFLVDSAADNFLDFVLGHLITMKRLRIRVFKLYLEGLFMINKIVNKPA